MLRCFSCLRCRRCQFPAPSFPSGRAGSSSSGSVSKRSHRRSATHESSSASSVRRFKTTSPTPWSVADLVVCGWKASFPFSPGTADSSVSDRPRRPGQTTPRPLKRAAASLELSSRGLTSPRFRSQRCWPFIRWSTSVCPPCSDLRRRCHADDFDTSLPLSQGISPRKASILSDTLRSSRSPSGAAVPGLPTSPSLSLFFAVTSSHYANRRRRSVGILWLTP